MGILSGGIVEGLNSMGGPLRGVGEVAGGNGASTRAQGVRDGPGERRQNRAAKQGGGTQVSNDQARTGQAALVEELRARGVREGKRKAARAAAPLPTPRALSPGLGARQRKLSTASVAALAYQAPPSRGRATAAQVDKLMRQDREQQVGEIVERLRSTRSVLQERAVAAYREAAGLGVDGRLGR
jgi:hypothetical protein